MKKAILILFLGLLAFGCVELPQTGCYDRVMISCGLDEDGYVLVDERPSVYENFTFKKISSHSGSCGFYSIEGRKHDEKICAHVNLLGVGIATDNATGIEVLYEEPLGNVIACADGLEEEGKTVDFVVPVELYPGKEGYYVDFIPHYNTEECVPVD